MGKKMLHALPTVARDAAGEWAKYGWHMSIPAGVEHPRHQVVDFEARLGPKPLYRWVDL